MKKPKLVYVAWLDAVHPTSGWIEHSEVEDEPAMLCETAGWLVKKTKAAIQVAVSYTIDEEGEISYSGIMVIPPKMVKTFRVIELSAYKKKAP